MTMANDVEQWMQNSKTFQYQGHSLFTKQMGDGKELLLIHGFPTSSLDWQLLWPELSQYYSLHTIDMLGFGLVDGVIPEPLGGTHWDYQGAADILKDYLLPVIKELKAISPEQRIEQRIEKFGKMGFWEET